MIRKDLLQNLPSQIGKSLDLLSYALGSQIGIQILYAAPTEDEFEAIEKLGSSPSVVNAARSKVGLHKVTIQTNIKHIKPEWKDSILNKEAAVFVFLNQNNRMKSNKTINDSIDYVLSNTEGIRFDKFDVNSKNDFFLCYVSKEEVIDPISEDPISEEIEEAPKKKRTKKAE